MKPPLKTPLQTLAYKQTKGLMPVPLFLDRRDSTKKHMVTCLGQAKAPKEAPNTRTQAYLVWRKESNGKATRTYGKAEGTLLKIDIQRKKYSILKYDLIIIFII